MQHRLTRALICVVCLSATPLWADMELLSTLPLDLPANVGGLSGLEVSEDGQEALLLSDRGWLFRGRIERDATGVATDLQITGTQRLRHDGEHNHPDSEGLAVTRDGRIFVTAEDPTRLLEYQWGNKDPQYFPTVPTERALDDNRGLEALAQAPDGSLLALFETPSAGIFPTYRFANRTWSDGPQIAATPGFSIVGADFDADGRLIVLERAFSALGFRTRLRRITLTDSAAQDTLLLQTDLGVFDNLEGIAVSQTPNGETRISLISDDNYLRILRMTLVEYVLQE